jgi:hypothetical protein
MLFVFESRRMDGRVTRLKPAQGKKAEEKAWKMFSGILVPGYFKKKANPEEEGRHFSVLVYKGRQKKTKKGVRQEKGRSRSEAWVKVKIFPGS